MKLAVLSDTHGLLRSEVKKIISECDAVLHAGDIASQKIIDEIEKAKRADAPLYIVRGNNDKEWAEHLPHHLAFSLKGFTTGDMPSSRSYIMIFSCSGSMIQYSRTSYFE